MWIYDFKITACTYTFCMISSVHIWFVNRALMHGVPLCRYGCWCQLKLFRRIFWRAPKIPCTFWNIYEEKMKVMNMTADLSAFESHSTFGGRGIGWLGWLNWHCYDGSASTCDEAICVYTFMARFTTAYQFQHQKLAIFLISELLLFCAVNKITVNKSSPSLFGAKPFHFDHDDSARRGLIRLNSISPFLRVCVSVSTFNLFISRCSPVRNH